MWPLPKLFKALSDPDVPYGPAPNPRMVIEQTPGFHITIYVSPDDKALALSSWLFGSLARLGRLDKAMLTPEQIEQARRLGIFDLIQVRGTTDLFGHSYFTSNPSVSADLIAMLRYGLRPRRTGPAAGRDRAAFLAGADRTRSGYREIAAGGSPGYRAQIGGARVAR